MLSRLKSHAVNFYCNTSMIYKTTKSNNRLQRPMEFFGQYTGLPAPILAGNDWDKLCKEQPDQPFKEFKCPFSHNTINCNKIRKAQPNPLIGNCVVRHCPKDEPDQDWIVCPKRFLQDLTVFTDCKSLLNPKCKEIYLAQEVELAGYGNLDFALIGYDESGDVLDFLAIEVQSMGTSSSGSIWTARNDYLNGKLKDKYMYGLNQKDASKKIMVQLLHKGAQVARWRFRLVLLVQDYFLDHLRIAYNLETHFHEEDKQDFVYIYSYQLLFDENKNKFYLQKKESLSTDIIGLSMALISNPNTGYIEFSHIASKIQSKKSKGELMQL